MESAHFQKASALAPGAVISRRLRPVAPLDQSLCLRNPIDIGDDRTFFQSIRTKTGANQICANPARTVAALQPMAQAHIGRALLAQ